MYDEAELDVLFRDSCRLTLKKASEIVDAHPQLAEESYLIMEALNGCLKVPIDKAARSMRSVQDLIAESAYCECDENKELHEFLKKLNSAFEEGARHLNWEITKRIHREYEITMEEAQMIFLMSSMTGVQAIALLSAYPKRETPLPDEIVVVPDTIPEDFFDNPTPE